MHVADSWFALSQADRVEALEYAAAQSGRPAHLLEKDIWVVWMRANSRQRQRQGAAGVFAGEFVDRVRLHQPPPSASRVSQTSAKRGSPPRKASVTRRTLRGPSATSSIACGAWRRPSPSASSATSGWSGRRFWLTPSQRAKAWLQVVTRPWRSARTTGVTSASRSGSKAGGGDIAPT